jgi:hypothetical protein
MSKNNFINKKGICVVYSIKRKVTKAFRGHNSGFYIVKEGEESKIFQKAS